MSLPTSHPLNGVAVKLERAQAHIYELEWDINEFRRLHPDVFSTNLNAQAFTHTIANFASDIDISRISVIAGEALHQMRSSLDHIVAQLLIKVPANNATIDAILENSLFPVYTKPASWASFDWTKLPGLSAAERGVIADYQPCNRTDGLPPEDHPLAVLASLNNIDKHRFVIRIVKAGRVTRIDLGPNFAGGTFEVSRNAVVGSSNAEAELVRGTLPPHVSELDMEVHATSEVAFKQVGTGRIEPVIPTLKSLLNFVGDLTNTFAAKFF